MDHGMRFTKKSKNTNKTNSKNLFYSLTKAFTGYYK